MLYQLARFLELDRGGHNFEKLEINSVSLLFQSYLYNDAVAGWVPDVDKSTPRTPSHPCGGWKTKSQATSFPLPKSLVWS